MDDGFVVLIVKDDFGFEGIPLGSRNIIASSRIPESGSLSMVSFVFSQTSHPGFAVTAVQCLVPQIILGSETT